MTKLLITVITPLTTNQFDLDTDVDIELPYEEFVKKIGLIALLDTQYPTWTQFDIDLYEIPKRDWEIKNEEKEDEMVVAQFDHN